MSLFQLLIEFGFHGTEVSGNRTSICPFVVLIGWEVFIGGGLTIEEGELLEVHVGAVPAPRILPEIALLQIGRLFVSILVMTCDAVALQDVLHETRETKRI